MARLVLLGWLFTMAVASAQQKHIVFVSGDHEYRSERSMPMLGRILDNQGFRVSYAKAEPTPQDDDNIVGLETLASADLAVFFLRWRRLPDDQIEKILAYVEAGKPAVGFRTSTHSFNYPEGAKYQVWNDRFGISVFGQKWIRHHGHMSTTNTYAAEGAGEHPILRGVEAEMELPSWLYVVAPLHGDSQPLLMGRAVNPRDGKDYGPQPVAWTKTHRGGRVFFTTLGHPDDFKNESMRRLALNGILWALGEEVPAGGADATIVGGYDPPPPGVPK